MQKDLFSVFIPARGGSKSIKDKNIQKINGVPLVERSIQLALKRFNNRQIVISSDSREILRIAEKYNINKHLRSKENSSDNATTENAIKEWLLCENVICDWIILLEPTSPFTSIDDIDKVIELSQLKKDISCIYSISEVRHTDHFLNQRIINKNKTKFLFFDEREKNNLKQNKLKTFKFGNISAIKSSALINSKKFFSEDSLTFEIPFHRSINIDSKEELIIARALAYYLDQIYEVV